MATFADLVRFLPTLGGTTDFIYSSAVGGCQSPSAANVLNGVKYKLYAVSSDLTQWETFEGAYNSGTGTFPRTTVLYNSSGTGTATGQTGAGTKINFSTVPQVSIVALAEDMPSLGTPNTFTDATEATGAGTTAAAIISGGLEVLKKLFVTGIAKFTAAVAASSTTTGSVVVTGGIGVSGAGWFGSDVNSAGAHKTTVAPTTAPHVDTSGMTAVSVANGANALISDSQSSYYLLFIVETTQTGNAAMYALRGAGAVSDLVLTGAWVTTTTTPAVGKLSVAWSGTQFKVYNNAGGTATFKCVLIKVA